VFITIILVSYNFDGLLSHIYVATFSTKAFAHKGSSSTVSNYQSTTA